MGGTGVIYYKIKPVETEGSTCSNHIRTILQQTKSPIPEKTFNDHVSAHIKQKGTTKPKTLTYRSDGTIDMTEHRQWRRLASQQELSESGSILAIAAVPCLFLLGLLVYRCLRCFRKPERELIPRWDN